MNFLQGQVPGTNVTKCSWNPCRASCGSLFVLGSNKVSSHPDLGHVIISIGKSRARIIFLAPPSTALVHRLYSDNFLSLPYLMNVKRGLLRVGGVALACYAHCTAFLLSSTSILRFQIRPNNLIIDIYVELCSTNEDGTLMGKQIEVGGS